MCEVQPFLYITVYKWWDSYTNTVSDFFPDPACPLRPLNVWMSPWYFVLSLILISASLCVWKYPIVRIFFTALQLLWIRLDNVALLCHRQKKLVELTLFPHVKVKLQRMLLLLVEKWIAWWLLKSTKIKPVHKSIL